MEAYLELTFQKEDTINDNDDSYSSFKWSIQDNNFIKLLFILYNFYIFQLFFFLDNKDCFTLWLFIKFVFTVQWSKIMTFSQKNQYFFHSQIYLFASRCSSQNFLLIPLRGAMGDWDFRISDLVKNPDGTDICPLWWISRSWECPLSQLHFADLHVGAPGIFSLCRY